MGREFGGPISGHGRAPGDRAGKSRRQVRRGENVLAQRSARQLTACLDDHQSAMTGIGQRRRAEIPQLRVGRGLLEQIDADRAGAAEAGDGMVFKDNIPDGDSRGSERGGNRDGERYVNGNGDGDQVRADDGWGGADGFGEACRSGDDGAVGKALRSDDGAAGEDLRGGENAAGEDNGCSGDGGGSGRDECGEKVGSTTGEGCAEGRGAGREVNGAGSGSCGTADGVGQRVGAGAHGGVSHLAGGGGAGGGPGSDGGGVTIVAGGLDDGFGPPIGLAAVGRTIGRWSLQARAEQKAPEGCWRHWLLIGGRGSGKTRAGAEWVQAVATADIRSSLRIALIAETLGDAREVMVDGLSGICRVAGWQAPDVEISRRRLVWPNGTVAQMFSSEDPESLRGPQFHLAWCDEIAKWKYAEDTFDMLQFGLRLGALPRLVATTTPRPVPLLKRLLADPATVTTRLTTQSNAGNLSPGFIAAMQARYGATRLGRQELMGELIEDREDGLWRRAQLEAVRIRAPGPMGRIVVGVDPPSGAGAASVCGIVVAGIEAGGRAVVLDDASVTGASPAEWAGAVMRAYHRFEADRVVAEVNQGGEMVASVLRSVEASLPLVMVRATRGKFLRAEPVAALYEQGRVAHAGRFAALEDQMCEISANAENT